MSIFSFIPGWLIMLVIIGIGVWVWLIFNKVSQNEKAKNERAKDTSQYRDVYHEALKSGDKQKALQAGRMYYLMLRTNQHMDKLDLNSLGSLAGQSDLVRFGDSQKNSIEDEQKIQNDILAMETNIQIDEPRPVSKLDSDIAEKNFIGERNLTNDAYKLFLLEKYAIKKNDVLEKFICENRIFDTVDLAIEFAANKEALKIEKKEVIEEVPSFNIQDETKDIPSDVTETVSNDFNRNELNHSEDKVPEIKGNEFRKIWLKRTLIAIIFLGIIFIIIGYVIKDAPNKNNEPLISSLPKINETEMQPNKDDGSLPQCVGEYNKSTWTNCWGERKINDGSSYKGGYVDGKAHGYGIYTFPDGSTYRGNYENGKRNGSGSEYSVDGKIINSGNWIDGRLVESSGLQSNQSQQPVKPLEPAYDKRALEEGFCLGAITMSLKMGSKIEDFSTVAIQQAKIISDKIKPIESRWGPTADKCFVAGVPMVEVHNCMQTQITDPVAYSFYKGASIARNRVASLSLFQGQVDANSLCVILQ